MANVNLSNLARMTVSSSGTGTITLNAAVPGFLTFDLSGLSTAAAGTVVRYAVNDTTQSEIAYGTYTSSALTLTRGSSTTGMKSTNSNSPINMSNAAQVFVTEAAADFPFVMDTGGTTATSSIALTMSAALTYGGVTLSNAVTGTGNMVLSAAPTFTGTVSGAALTLSGVLTYGGVALNAAVTGTGNMVLSAAPTFTGVPIAPTAAVDTNTTQIATTGFVVAQAGSATPLIDAGTGAVGTSLRYSRQDHVHPYPFASGTLMLFQQTSAPTGWTKQATHNDKALRVVSGAAGSGGSSPFSTVFAQTATDSHTLTIDEIPAHNHPILIQTAGGAQNAPEQSFAAANYAEDNGSNNYIGNRGGGLGHTHTMDIRVQYVDIIIASKD